MRTAPLACILCLFCVAPLLGQLDGEEYEAREEVVARPDHGERARPRFAEEEERHREKRDLRPILLAAPISTEFGLFLNRNTIEETGSQPQNESSIAINPVNPKMLIASAVDGRGAFVYISDDGGFTWRNHSFGAIHDNWVSGNDPSVAFDYLGNGYVMYGGFPRSSTPTGESGVYVARTTDNGATWQAHIPVIEHIGTMTLDSAFEDKYYIEIDNSPTSPYRGYIYTPWKRVIDRDSSTQIVFTRSLDGGLTWSVPIPVSPRKSGTSLDTTFGQSFPISTTGPDGTIYVCWNDGPIRSIGFARSSDAGLTFTQPRYPVQGYPTLGTARRVGESVYHVLKETFRAETYPTLMADNSQSPRRGWLYLAWAAGRSPDIYFTRSTDRGETWSEPKIIHSNPANDQWWPWLSVDETTGDIGVMYSDSRNDPENILIDTYVSYSSDGGDTWIDRRVTDMMSDFRDNPYQQNVFAGDYSGNAFHDGKIYPSFLDTRTDNDVYTAVVDLRKPWPVENLRASGRYGQPDQVTLTWENPPLETIFGLPIDDYSLVVARDGAVLTVLPAATTSYRDDGRQEGVTYAYAVRVVAGSDSSVWRNVTFDYDDARPPAPADIIDVVQYRPEITLHVAIPTVRADRTTPLENLKAYRLYRDGELVREGTLDISDTGRTITINDTPPERGYYRYWLSLVDEEDPANVSAFSDTVIAYAGSLSSYTEHFDLASPRFLKTGTWGETSALSLSPSNSLTDSPDRNYAANRDTWTRIFPVRAAAPIGLRFAHIAIVAPGDSAIVEVSYDSGATWTMLRDYNINSDPAWTDRKADAGDWRQEDISVPSPGADGIAVVRFRLYTSAVTNLDGWYIDDIAFGGPAGVARETGGTFAAHAYPNPARDAAIISYTLPSEADVTVRVVDVMGREVVHLLDARQDAGGHAVTLDGSALPNGVYIYEIATGATVERGRIVLAH